ncbi:hypothetical protein [Halobaculum sp. EA56]|uniref:hypothetical protein n=1 Tax=Halobaculum sp. EA56 TaxID=3421648 RepID=UPI003EBE04E7
MNRRGFLGSLARLSVPAGAVGVAGCTSPASPSGPRTPPRSPEATATGDEGLVVVDFADVEGEEGNLLVRVTVENRSSEERSGTVVVRARVNGEDGSEEETVSEDVSVAAGDRVKVTLATSLSYEEFSRGGSMRVEID